MILAAVNQHVTYLQVATARRLFKAGYSLGEAARELGITSQALDYALWMHITIHPDKGARR